MVLLCVLFYTLITSTVFIHQSGAFGIMCFCAVLQRDLLHRFSTALGNLSSISHNNFFTASWAIIRCFRHFFPPKVCNSFACRVAATETTKIAVGYFLISTPDYFL